MKTEKTALEWFEQLPEPIRTQAINNLDEHSSKKKFEQLHVAIGHAFSLVQSNEGIDYWDKIFFRAYKGDFTPNLNGWIPVGERLPEEGGENYLVIINGAVTIDLFRADHKKFHNEIHNSIDKLTHWQPLPKLPEVKL